MAKKNADVHFQIMEILTAYIRENAPVAEGTHERKPRQDIQLAFTVIGRRPPKRIALERLQKFRLDLNNCDLTRIEGRGFDFAKADFIGTRFVRSQLKNANMQYATLVNANLQHARHLTDAFLRGAALKSIDFTNIPISQDQLELTFGDESVILPKSLDRPSHWPHEDLSPTLFRHQWRAWHETLPPDGD
ncbi:MAG: pentapeptide repeat-containing protein [Rhodobacteraceae bacterium]|nr:pentapeptide repeat-containing protein [Paracoccaceae bacterium]